MAAPFLEGLVPIDETAASSQPPAAPNAAPDFLRGLMPLADPNAKPYDPGELRSIAPYGTTDALVHGLTLGVSDPLRAAQTAGVRYLFGDTPNFDYAKAQQEIARGREFYAASSPWASEASNVAGSMAFPGTLAARGIQAVASPVAKIIASGLLGGGMGAVQGAADRGDTLQNAAQGAVSGGETGALVGAAVPAAANLIPGMLPAAQTLRSAGIEPLPGAARGGILGWAEDMLSKFPGVGLPIAGAKQDAQQQLAQTITRNREAFPSTAVNHALEPIGETLSPTALAGSGNDMANEMVTKAGNAYNAAVPNAGAAVDAAAHTALADIRTNLALSAPEKLAQYDAFLKAKFHDPLAVAPAGSLTGQAFRGAESDLGREYSNLLSGRSTADERTLGEAYRQVQGVLRENLARNAPESAAEIAAANETWKRLLPVRDATASDLVSGMFSPQQLASSARKFAGRSNYAVGRAPMQDFAQDAMASEQALTDARSVLGAPRSLGLHDLAGSVAMGVPLFEHIMANPTPGRIAAVGVPYGLLSALYSNPGRGAINQGLQGARGLLDAATPYAPAAGTFAPAAPGFASGLLNLAGGG